MNRCTLFFFLLLFLIGATALGQIQPASQTPGKAAGAASLPSKIVPRKVASATATSLPLTMSYQGLLTTDAGTPVADGSYDLQFDLYDSLTGGTSLWNETHSSVSVQRGTFSVTLGSVSPLNLQFNQPLFVHVRAISGPAGPSYPLKFAPRTQLTSAPYSLAPWVTNGTDIYYKNGAVAMGASAPESSGIGTLKLELGDEDGGLSDIALRVAGGGNGRGFGILNFAKSRGTLATPAVAVQGDAIGQMDFLGYDGAAFQDAAAITSWVGGPPAVGNMPGTLDLWTTPLGSTSPSVRMHIMPGGDIGIGTLSPRSALTIERDTVSGRGGYLTLMNGDGGGGANCGIEFATYNPANYPPDARISAIDEFSWSAGLSFSTKIPGTYANPLVERMRITSAGRVGIGTNSPSAFLTVDDTSYNYFGLTSLIIHDHAGDYGYGLEAEAPWVGVLGFSTGAALTGSYGVEGSAQDTAAGGSSVGVYATAGASASGGTAFGVFGTTNAGAVRYAGYFSGDLAYTGSLIHASDATLKEDVRPFSGALSSLMQLQPRTYRFKSSREFQAMNLPGGNQYGFVAQDVEKVLPDLVVDAVQPPPKDDRTSTPLHYKGLKYLDMIPILVQAIQEQQHTIEAQQKTIDELKAMVLQRNK